MPFIYQASISLVSKRLKNNTHKRVSRAEECVRKISDHAAEIMSLYSLHLKQIAFFPLPVTSVEFTNVESKADLILFAHLLGPF